MSGYSGSYEINHSRPTGAVQVSERAGFVRSRSTWPRACRRVGRVHRRGNRSRCRAARFVPASAEQDTTDSPNKPVTPPSGRGDFVRNRSCAGLPMHCRVLRSVGWALPAVPGSCQIGALCGGAPRPRPRAVVVVGHSWDSDAAGRTGSRSLHSTFRGSWCSMSFRAPVEDNCAIHPEERIAIGEVSNAANLLRRMEYANGHGSETLLDEQDSGIIGDAVPGEGFEPSRPMGTPDYEGRMRLPIPPPRLKPDALTLTEAWPQGKRNPEPAKGTPHLGHRHSFLRCRRRNVLTFFAH